MKFPFITRKEHEAKIADLEKRIEDIASQFVTKRDPQTGMILETLADRHRKGVKPPKRVTMKQLCSWLERTDGGRKVESGKPA